MRFAGAAWCVVVAAGLVGPPVAIAAPPASATPAPTESQLAEARQHQVAGSKLYDLAEYEAALREFKDAYRAVDDPAFLFNIAQCHRKLGHTQDAITFYRNYLRRAPHAANKAEVERRIAELERAPAQPAPPPAGEPTAPVAPLVIDQPPPAPDKGARVDASLVGPASSAPATNVEAPFYKRGWFWLVAGAVVAGTATTFIILSTRSDSAPFCPDCARTVTTP
ncbi:MAG TPA: tetratricopeptide repeat protein [Polyangia bacterium]|jgi:tetratricopeptide (TPR) repeat protein|nr:tetratricopeptide repeat protein [Polyangia bacterium]